MFASHLKQNDSSRLRLDDCIRAFLWTYLSISSLWKSRCVWVSVCVHTHALKDGGMLHSGHGRSFRFVSWLEITECRVRIRLWMHILISIKVSFSSFQYKSSSKSQLFHGKGIYSVTLTWKQGNTRSLVNSSSLSRTGSPGRTEGLFVWSWYVLFLCASDFFFWYSGFLHTVHKYACLELKMCTNEVNCLYFLSYLN